MFSSQDQTFMQRAIELAQCAAEIHKEVPIGAVLVLDNKIIAEGFNQPISSLDPTAHAEIVVMRAAAKAIGNYRLIDTTLYVTLEPCIMCAGAMIHARIKRLVYGASDLRAGAVTTKLQCLDQSFVNHRVHHEGGLMADACKIMLSNFFKERR